MGFWEIWGLILEEIDRLGGTMWRIAKGLRRNQYSVAIHKLRRVPTMVTLTLWAIEPYPTVGLRRDTSIARSYDYVI